MTEYWRVTIAAALVISAASFVMFQTTKIRNIALHKQFLAASDNDEFRTSFIRSYFQSYSSERKVCINESYNSNCLNIVLYRIPESGNKNGLDERYRRNIFAIGSDIIAFDKELLDLLLISSSYAFKSRMASFIFNDSGLSPFATAVLWAQQYTNIIRNSDKRWPENEAEKIKAGVLGIEATDPKQVSAFAGVGDLRTYARLIMVAAFSLLIEHEIAHLDVSPLQRFYLRLRSMLQHGLTGISRAEEDYVDLVAIGKTEEVIKSIHEKVPATENTGIELTGLLANFLFLWVEGMFDFFEHLRGNIFAEDYFFEVNFDECQVDPEVLAAIPDQVFAMIPSLRQARFKPLPILTRAEFERLMQRFGAAASHTHSAVRADFILQRIWSALNASEAAPTNAEAFGILPGLVQSVQSGSTSLSQKDISQATSLRTDDIVKALVQFGAAPDTAFLCPTYKCLVFVEQSLSVEIAADEEFIKEVRIAGPVDKLANNKAIGAVLNLITTVAEIDFEDIPNAIRDVSSECPGSYRIVQKSNAGPFVHINRMVTKDHVQLRFLQAD